MNKAELVQAVAESSGTDKRQVEGVLGAFFDTVRTQTKGGEKVAWPGFGSFQTTQRGARTGRNPRTGDPVKIKASTGIKFSPSSGLKEFLNTKGSAKKGGAKKAAGAAGRSTAKAAGTKATAKKTTAKATTKRATAKKTTKR